MRGAHENIAATFIHLHWNLQRRAQCPCSWNSSFPWYFRYLQTSVVFVCIKGYILLMQISHPTRLALKGGDDYYRYSSPLVVGDLSYS